MEGGKYILTATVFISELLAGRSICSAGYH